MFRHGRRCLVTHDRPSLRRLRLRQRLLLLHGVNGAVSFRADDAVDHRQAFIPLKLRNGGGCFVVNRGIRRIADIVSLRSQKAFHFKRCL